MLLDLMEKFKVSAEFKVGKRVAYMKSEVEARDEDHARDLVVSRIGGRHKTPRRFINILRIAKTSKTSVVLDDGSKKR